MPGFVERGMSGRQRAFDDGIKMAEQRSGKQISKIVDTPGMYDEAFTVLEHSVASSLCFCLSIADNSFVCIFCVPQRRGSNERS